MLQQLTSQRVNFNGLLEKTRHTKIYEFICAAMGSNWAAPHWEWLRALPTNRNHRKGFYRGDAEASQGNYLIAYSLRGVTLSSIIAKGT